MHLSVRAIVATSAALLSLTCSISSGFAADPPADPAGAEMLFDEGRKLLDAGKIPEACAKLEASNRLDPAVGTLLNLGDCNERRGRLASAWSNYRAAVSLAMTRGDTTRADFARKKSDGLQPKLSTLSIVVPTPEPGLKVVRDTTVVVDDGVWGAAIPIDAGAHVIEARAPGKKLWSVKIVVAEGAPSASVVRVEALVPDTTSVPSSSPNDAGARPAETPTHTGRIVGAIGLGVGAIGLGVGTYFALHARSLWNDAAPHCTAAHVCDDEGFNKNADARAAGNVATVLFTAGIVLAAAGAAALLFWPKPAPTPRAAAWQLHGAGVSF